MALINISDTYLGKVHVGLPEQALGGGANVPGRGRRLWRLRFAVLMKIE